MSHHSPKNPFGCSISPFSHKYRKSFIYRQHSVMIRKLKYVWDDTASQPFPLHSQLKSLAHTCLALTCFSQENLHSNSWYNLNWVDPLWPNRTNTSLQTLKKHHFDTLICWYVHKQNINILMLAFGPNFSQILDLAPLFEWWNAKLG